MSANRLLLFVLLVLGSLRAAAQGGPLLGRVVDDCGRPVPFASVGWADGSASTATNEVGEFSLRPGPLPQRLVVLSMGYGRLEAEVRTIKGPLRLMVRPSTIALPEVVVRNPDKEAEVLVARATAKLLRHQRDLQYGKAFYRQKTLQNGHYREFFDAFYDVKFSSRWIEGWDLGESRYAFLPGGFTFTNFSQLLRRVPVFSPRPRTEKLLVPLGNGAAAFFHFTLRSFISENGRETAVIDFEPQPTVNRPATSGTLYIDRRTAVLRRQEQALPLSSMLSFSDLEPACRLLGDSFRLVTEFAPFTDSLSRLASARADGTIVLGRPGVRPDSTKVSAYLFFYQYNDRLPDHAYQEVKRNSRDLEQIMKKPYNPRFWLENEVLRASPLERDVIRAFEGRKVFGRL